MIVTLNFVMNIVAKNRTIKAENVIIMGDKNLIKKDIKTKQLDLNFSRIKEKFSSSFCQLDSHACTSPRYMIITWNMIMFSLEV